MSDEQKPATYAALALGDPSGTCVQRPVVPDAEVPVSPTRVKLNDAPSIVVRISGAVGVGKTHVAETIRAALERRYGISGSLIDITLTDIKHDSAVGNDYPPPAGTSFKIIEDIASK